MDCPTLPKPKTRLHRFLAVVVVCLLALQIYIFDAQRKTIGNLQGYEWPSLWPMAGVVLLTLALIVSVRQYQKEAREVRWVRRDGQKLP